MNLYLVAKGGDCSNGAMGNSNDAILVESKHYDLVKRYLHSQLSFEMGVSISDTEGKLCSQDVIDKYWNLLDELSKANIFKHKYHCRTYWTLVSENGLEDHQPVSIDDVLVEFKQ